MTAPRLRAAAAAAALVVLAGCAPTGQAAPAGVAATWGEDTITNSDVTAVHADWDAATAGRDVPQRPSIVTIELLGPALVEAAAKTGNPVRESDAIQFAREWTFFTQSPNDPGEEMVEAVQAIISLAILSLTQPENTIVREIAEAAAAEAEISPRVGEWSAEAFVASVDFAKARANTGELGNFAYVAFQDVSGFVSPGIG